jgi:hypothetical protein
MERTISPRIQHDRRHAAGAIALLLCCAVAALVPAPSASAAALEKGFWGPTETNGVSQFPIYEQLGVTVYQTGISWAAVAPTQPADPTNPADPAYVWPADMDATIAEAAKHGMSVLIVLINAPPWANGGRTPEYAPTNPADFAAFARAAARRYPAVKRWMIWGEPSRSNNWKPFVIQPIGAPLTPAMRIAPRRYARLLDAAYGALKAVRKSNIVIGGNTYVTGEVRPTDWVRSMKLPNGRPPRMDQYGHNPFSVREPDLKNPPSAAGLVDFSDLARFDKLIQRYLGRPRHKHIRLWLAEYTIPTFSDSEFNYHVTPKLQAKWITSAFRVARKLDVAGLGWIHLYDVNAGFIIGGGLLREDGTRKPGFYAFMRGGLTAAQRARRRG